jgi:hypothetical protein
MELGITLKCNHSFCFLCLKSYYKFSNKLCCPLCRKEVEWNTLEKVINHKEEEEEDIQWHYKGRNFGWWKFDKKNNIELEKLYQKHKDEDYVKEDNTIAICGNTYYYDFEEMKQISLDGNIRNILRVENDEMNDLIKGISGLKYVCD